MHTRTHHGRAFGLEVSCHLEWMSAFRYVLSLLMRFIINDTIGRLASYTNPTSQPHLFDLHLLGLLSVADSCNVTYQYRNATPAPSAQGSMSKTNSYSLRAPQAAFMCNC
jgi:hypothetical protein